MHSSIFLSKHNHIETRRKDNIEVNSKARPRVLESTTWILKKRKNLPFMTKRDFLSTQIKNSPPYKSTINSLIVHSSNPSSTLFNPLNP